MSGVWQSPSTALCLSAIVGFLSGCRPQESSRDVEAIGNVSQALSQSDIVVCTGPCAEAFGGTPSVKFPVYYATRLVTPPGGGSPEVVVSAAFLMKCGANSESAARVFGYDPRLTSASGLDQREPIDDLESLKARLGGMTPVTLDCTTPPFFQVFRRIDARHSATAPAYYVQLHRDLIQQAAALGGTPPPDIYGLDCANPLIGLWEKWVTDQDASEILNSNAVPINGAVVQEWTQAKGITLPTIFCGTTAAYRTELPIDPPKSTKSVAVPSNQGAELYYVRTSFNGVANASGAYYLISNGLGFAIDGCGANINALGEALGISPDTDYAELPTTDPKFTSSNPNGQPVLRCNDSRGRVFESTNAPKPYRYFSFGSHTSSAVRFACEMTERFFLGNLANPEPTQVTEESLAFLSGSGTAGKVFDVGCARETVNEPDPPVSTCKPCPIGAFDGKNCLLAVAPPGTEAFIYASSFYYSPCTFGCPLAGSKFDGENCYYMEIPEGGFLWDNGFYASPKCSGGTCDQCPFGTFDGANCHLADAPSGTEAFAYGSGFFYTPAECRSQCPLPGSSFDGANCFYMKKPEGGFLWENGFYARPVQCN